MLSTRVRAKAKPTRLPIPAMATSGDAPRRSDAQKAKQPAALPLGIDRPRDLREDVAVSSKAKPDDIGQCAPFSGTLYQRVQKVVSPRLQRGRTQRASDCNI